MIKVTKYWILLALPVVVIEIAKFNSDMNCGLIQMACKYYHVFPNLIYWFLVWSGIACIVSDLFCEKVLRVK